MDDFKWLKNYTKCFPCNGNDITILDTPGRFYTTLKEKIEGAKHRVVLSSLYIGTGKLEKELIETLLQRCHLHKLNKNHSFQVLILLDYLRGSRSVKNVDGISALGISDTHRASIIRPLSGSGSTISEPPSQDGFDRIGQTYRRSAADIILPSDYTSSREMVLPLLKHYSDQARVYLYRSPKFSTLKRLLLSGSFREITGLNHVKAYIIDDDIIISGANLSQTYFTDRQDRYMLIRNNNALCDHVQGFIKLICRASYCLLPDDTTFLPPLFSGPVTSNEDREKRSDSFITRAALGEAVREHFDGLIQRRVREERAKAVRKAMRRQKEDIWDKRSRALPFLPLKRFKYETLEQNGSSISSFKAANSIDLAEPPHLSHTSNADTTSVEDFTNGAQTPQYDTYIYPLVQAGPHGVYSDHEATAQLLTKVEPGSRLWLATGYFNMVPSYADILLNKTNPKPIVTDDHKQHSYSIYRKGKKPLASSRPLYSANLIIASPQANGFFGAAGFKKYVPLIYSYAANLFYDKIHVPFKWDIDEGSHSLLKLLRKILERCHLCAPTYDYNTPINPTRPEDINPNQITLWEYARQGWTYHAKGLWLYPPLERFPNLTFVGSSNFGYRSVYRDLEMQLAVVTSNPNLQEQLQNELDSLLEHSSQVNSNTFLADYRKVPLWLKVLYRFIKSYL